MTPVKIPVRSWVSQNLRQDFKMLLIVKSFQKTLDCSGTADLRKRGLFLSFPTFYEDGILFWYKLHMKYKKEKITILHRLFPETTIKFLGNGWPQTPPPPPPPRQTRAPCICFQAPRIENLLCLPCCYVHSAFP